MHRSYYNATVVTLLSPCPSASRRMMESLQQLLLTPLRQENNKNNNNEIKKESNVSSSISSNERYSTLDESWPNGKKSPLVTSSSSLVSLPSTSSLSSTFSYHGESTVDQLNASWANTGMQWDSLAIEFVLPSGNSKDKDQQDLQDQQDSFSQSTILHWLSLKPRKDSNSTKENFTDSNNSTFLSNFGKRNSLMRMDLLSVHNVNCVQDVRDRLAQQLEHPTFFLTWFNQKVLGRTLQLKDLTNDGKPIIDFGNNIQLRQLRKLEEQNIDQYPNPTLSSNSTTTITLNRWNDGATTLKEVVIPVADDDGTSLFDFLSQQNGLKRPVTGLYQSIVTSNVNAHETVPSFCIRPLPIAKEDRKLPPPTLVFHTPDLQRHIPASPTPTITMSTSNNYNKDPYVFHKIGFTGGGMKSNIGSQPMIQGWNGQGQLLVRNSANMLGLDIRLCSRTTLSSMFCEAQESMLASSLPGLQSKYVANSGGQITVTKTKQTSTVDSSSKEDNELVVDGDCWKEFRTSVRSNPLEYFRNFTNSQVKTKRSQHRIARAPDIPYE